MGLIDWWSERRARRAAAAAAAAQRNEALARYRERLTAFASADADQSEAVLSELAAIAREANLSDGDRHQEHVAACRHAWAMTSADSRVSADEHALLERVLTHLGVTKDEMGFDQTVFSRSRAMAQLEAGELPTPMVEGLSVQLKRGEIVHWLCHAELRRLKTETKRVRYGGFTTSIKIVGRLRYRVGDLAVQRVTSEYVATEDSGTLWLTNQRIGFLGPRKNFTLPYGKVLSFEVTPEGLRIVKEGRGAPFIVMPDDLEVPCAVISLLLPRTGT